MSNNSAEEYLERAIEFGEQGQTDGAITAYQQAICLEPEWSVPHYNLGLLYKYQCNWQLSYQHNQKAVELDPTNEAAWWNLGIAATVLLDWRTAREAWNKFGLSLEINNEEPDLDLANVPIRLNPDDEGEVVWCRRIDPARTVILNVPLATCGHRYGDIVLNDGAPQGYRIHNGNEVPVFNELQLLTRSTYSTYSIMAYTDDQGHIDKLEELCHKVNVEFEDWSSSITMLCKQCSEGIPHENHDHDLKEGCASERNIGLASKNKDAVILALADWCTITHCKHSELILALE
ncbi:tetratricopeptide repeat protein [Mucilaginibacter sp. NFX135]|uniref:tetratricopeptide repeat protein n=1 Tax=Mucilaginibacter sp. NFX135 TaxID=3402687 RepID=UPI003AFA7DDD